MNPLYVNYFYTDIHFRNPMYKCWTTELYTKIVLYLDCIHTDTNIIVIHSYKQLIL